MKCVVIHNDTQEEGTEPLYSRSLRKKSGSQVSVGHFFVVVYRACPSDAAMAQVQNPV